MTGYYFASPQHPVAEMAYFGDVYNDFGALNSVQLQHYGAETACSAFAPVEFPSLENWRHQTVSGASPEAVHQRHLEMSCSEYCQNGVLGNGRQMAAHSPYSCVEQFLNTSNDVCGSEGKCNFVTQEIKDGGHKKSSSPVDARINHDNADVIKHCDTKGMTKSVTRVVKPTKRRVLTDRLITITRHYKNINAAITQVDFRLKLVQDGWYKADALPSATTIGRAFSQVKHETMSPDYKDQLKKSGSAVTHRKRVAFDAYQRQTLNKAFQRCQYPTSLEYDNIVNLTGLYRETIKVWFSNKRAKLRKERHGNHQPDVRQMAAPTQSSRAVWIGSADANIQHRQTIAMLGGAQYLLPPSDHPVNHIVPGYNQMNDLPMTSQYGAYEGGEVASPQQTCYVFPGTNEMFQT